MRPRILAVDDEPDMLWGLRYALGDEGYEVDTAGNAAEALTLAADQRPDLIVLDVVMPGVDGFEPLLYVEPGVHVLLLLALKGDDDEIALAVEVVRQLDRTFVKV